MTQMGASRGQVGGPQPWPIRTRRGGAALLLLMLGMLAASPALPVASQTADERRYLYVAKDNEYEIFDIADGHRFLRSIALPGYTNPRGMRASAATQRLYISYKRGPAGPSLLAFDLRTDRLLWATPFAPDADAISITPDGQTLYMASGEDTSTDYFFVIDAATGQQRGTIPIHDGTHNTIVNLTGTRVYLSSLHYRYLHVVDTTTNQLLKKIGPFTDAIRPFTINGRETMAFVNVNHLQGFEVADLKTGRMLHRVEVQGFPLPPDYNVIDPSHGVGLTPDEREVWLAGATPFVHVFDATVMPPRQVASIPVQKVPKWIGFSRDGRYMYPGTGDVIDTQTRTVVGRVPSSKRQVEVDFLNGRAVAATDIYGVGQMADTSLLVVGDHTALSGGDRAVLERLETLGYDLKVVSDQNATSGSATQMDVIILSSTVSSGNVGTQFRWTPVPLITWEPFLFDDLGMTGATSADQGFAGGQTQVRMQSPTHPLAAGLGGTITVTTAAREMAWGRPSVQAVIAATHATDPHKASIFGYDRGAAMASIPAPARRVGFLLSNDSAGQLTAQGWSLFDAAVRWATAAP